MVKRYVFLEHMSDAYIEAYGKSLGEAYSSAAQALIDAMIHIESVEEKMEESIHVRGTDLHSLLYNWLEEVLLKLVVEGKVFSSFDVTMGDGFTLSAKMRGEALSLEKHRPKLEVKAVTYHLMEIDQKPSLVTLRFLLDL